MADATGTGSRVRSCSQSGGLPRTSPTNRSNAVAGAAISAEQHSGRGPGYEHLALDTASDRNTAERAHRLRAPRSTACDLVRPHLRRCTFMQNLSRLTSRLACLRFLFLFGAVVLVAGCVAKKPVILGTWTGTIGGGTTKPVGVRFTFDNDNDGKFTGRVFFQDPDTNEYGDDGTLSGALDGSTATWTTETDVVIKGTFEETKFTGTIEFPPDEGRPTRPGPITLTR